MAQLPIHELSDGKLINYGIKTRFSLEDKKRLINCLIDLVRERANPQIRDYGIRGLEIIRNDAGTPPNYQSADKLFADDVICEICKCLSEVNDDEVIDTVVNHIAEQYKDMITTSGYCPSGRLNRAANVYFFLRDYVDGLKK